MFDKDCFQYYILSKRSSKIQAEMLSGNYALTSRGAGKGGVAAVCARACLWVRVASLALGVFA